MADIDSVLYSIAAFICALFVLEVGADKFIDHTAVLAKRTGIPEGLIALLTAGAEWEELAVVVFAIARGRNSLALGNVVGSAISNILGAFSLGLLFSGTAGDGLSFDASSRRYTILQLAITILAAVSLGLREHLHLRVIGIALILIFVLYIGSIFWAIRKGLVTGPELSESDDDSESASESDEEINHRSTLAGTTSAYGTFNGESNPSAHNPSSSAEAQPLTGDNTGLFPNITHHSPTYHLFHLLVGFWSLLISAYVLTHAATMLVDQLGLSDEVFGLVVLSIATTLPEKLVASLSGLRGQTGIMVANTVGSNIFLLTLCLGIVWVSPYNNDTHAAIGAIELVNLIASSAAMCIVVFTRGNVAKGLGLGFLVAYFAFLSLEITFMRQD
jgi:Ca2+/Na+ antiporter